VRAHVRAVDAALGAPPGPAGSGTVEANLTAYIDRSLALHAAILPAFAGLVGQPGVLARLNTLPDPAAGGQGLREDLANYLRAKQRLGRLPADADADAAATMLIGACYELIVSEGLADPSLAECVSGPSRPHDDHRRAVRRGQGAPGRLLLDRVREHRPCG
jgi:hypothetical protein